MTWLEKKAQGVRPLSALSPAEGTCVAQLLSQGVPQNLVVVESARRRVFVPDGERVPQGERKGSLPLTVLSEM